MIGSRMNLTNINHPTAAGDTVSKADVPLNREYLEAPISGARCLRVGFALTSLITLASTVVATEEFENSVRLIQQDFYDSIYLLLLGVSLTNLYGHHIASHGVSHWACA